MKDYLFIEGRQIACRSRLPYWQLLLLVKFENDIRPIASLKAANIAMKASGGVPFMVNEARPFDEIEISDSYISLAEAAFHLNVPKQSVRQLLEIRYTRQHGKVPEEQVVKYLREREAEREAFLKAYELLK